MTNSNEFDVAIIGAGLSGLTAAYEITKQKPATKLVILEATSHIGGPIKTITMRGAKGDDQWDIGPSRIGSKQKEILDLVGEMGLETYEHYVKGKKYWQLPSGEIKSYSGKIPPLPYTSLLDALRYFKKVDGFQGKVNLENAGATPKAEEWDNMTVEELKSKTLWTQSAKEVIEVMTMLFFGLPTQYLTVMHYVHTIATCGNWDNHVGGEGTGKLDLRIKGGTKQLLDRLVEKIGKDNIKMNSRVTKIQQEGGTQACIETENGDRYIANKVIVATPVLCNAHITFSPPLQSNHLLPSGINALFFVITYRESFWRNAGSCADILSMKAILGAVKDDIECPVIIVFDHTSASGNPALMGAFGAISLENKTREERKYMVVKFLKDVYKSDEPGNVLDYRDSGWKPCDKIPPEESFKEQRASYVLSSIRKPEGVIHWAGSYTATAWADCLSGAVQAGKRAAREVI